MGETGGFPTLRSVRAAGAAAADVFGGVPSSTWKLWPQPHEELAFGLSILKPDSASVSRKSMVAPFRYGALNGSTTTLHVVELELEVARLRAAVEAERVLEAAAAAALDRDAEHLGLAGGLARHQAANLVGRPRRQSDDGLL